MEVPAADLARIRELYVQGRYRQALAAADGFGPLRTWANTPARLLAGRLAMQLGAPRLGRRLHAAAFRASPSNLEAVYYHARYRFERFGPLSCWRFLRRHTDWADASPELRADWLALTGYVAARLHDFDRAERSVRQAEELAPRRPWVCVERAAVLEAVGRPDEAMVSARRALELHPWFRPAVQAVAHLLLKGGQDADAEAFLAEADEHLESGIVAAQLAAVRIDRRQYAGARGSLNRYAELSPLLEPDGAKWLAARRADVAYFLGERDAVVVAARQVSEEFYTSFADRLEGAKPTDGSPWDASRLVLPVDLSYTGQPPTVYDLLARHFDHPFPNPAADGPGPLDGLPDAAERRRAEAAGWACREFTLTLDVAFEVLSEGVPFLLTLVEVGVSQPRLVIGADRLRRSLLLADGHDQKPAEAPIDVLLTRFAASGPRALTCRPAGLVGRGESSNPDAGRAPRSGFEDSPRPTKDGSPLPDEPLYDALHRIQGLLADARFVDARAAIDRFQADHPGHRLSKQAAIAWARGAAHPVLLLDAVAALLADFPTDSTLALSKAAALRELGRTDERKAVLAAAASAKDADPLLLQSLAQMLLPDPREQEHAELLLRRSVRVRPHAAAGYYLLASQRWEAGRFPEAVDLYRFACCLDDREEQFADAYFRVARATDAVPEALRLFQQRVTRPPQPPPAAVKALFAALLDRDEPDQAFAALDRAIEKLTPVGEVVPHASVLLPSPLGGEGLGVRGGPPAQEDTSFMHGRADPSPPLPQGERGAGAALADLRLFRAEMFAAAGRHADAAAELARAEQLAPPLAFHKTAARLAKLAADPTAALTHLQAALDRDPLWTDGHRLAVGLIAEVDGRTAARRYAAELAARFPYVYPAVRLRAELVSPESDESAVTAVQTVLDLCPHDAWAHRQLALVLADRKRDAEALDHARRAGQTEPDHPSQFAVLAHVHRRADRIESALEAYRAALKSNVDHELAVSELVTLSRGRKEKRRALRFIAEQLHQQPHGGDGLTAYRDQVLQLAAEEDGPDLLDELLVELERVLDERPDLWQAWSLVIQQMGLMQRLDEARSLAEDATARFPLLAQLWSDLARVRAAQGNTDDRIEALRQAVSAAPTWTPAAHELAEALADADEDDEAVAVLERAAVRSPTDPNTHAALAERLWQANRPEEALDRVTSAVRHDPGYEPGWRMLVHWADRLDRPDEPIAVARELTRTRPGDVRGWLRLARLLHDAEHASEALAALDTVVTLDPASVEAHDLRAERLAELGRFEEALEAAKPAALAADLPLVLQGRAAWVEAKRGNYAAAIPPMQALVSVEPEYFWGWQQLAEWYNETGRSEGFLEAASELVRLKPDHPIPLTLRGEAKLKTGDRGGGKTDLRDALRLAPQYAPAAALLFDACLADGEIRDARAALAVLQEHAGGPEVLVKQVQLACRTNDTEGALRTLAEAAGTAGEGPPIVLQLVLAELDAAGLTDRAGPVLRDVWQGGEPFNPWAPIYWLDTPDGEAAPFDDRLAATDATIRDYPTYPAGYDRKAELLSQVGRHEEALAVLRAPAVGDPPPLVLRGRAAWIEARRGNRAKAITLMKQAVADDPGYLWGWRQLAQWADAEGRHKECLDAAEQMVRLSPDDPLAFGYRGEARRTLGDRDGAKADFEKAFALDPKFDAAGLHLIAEQLEAGELEAAANTLARLQEHADGPLVRLRAVQVACGRGELPTARDRLRALATDPDAPCGVLRDAAAAMDAEGWAAEADDELADVVGSADLTPAAAAVWAERLIRDNRAADVLAALPRLFERHPPAGREATVAYAAAVANAGRPDQAAATVHRFGDQLRQDTESWAKAGAALAEARSFALAASWLSDWSNRDGVEGWMLRPLADALRAQDRDAEAAEVSRAGYELGGPPPVRADFAGWLALDAALDANTEYAAELLRGVDQVGLSDGVKLLLAVAEAVLMVARAGPDGKAAAFAEAKEHLKAAAGACAAADVPPGLGRWYKRAVGRMAADAGGLGAAAWAGWQKLRPWVRG